MKMQIVRRASGLRRLATGTAQQTFRRVSSQSPAPIINAVAIETDLAARPAHAVYDVLSPTHSHLLNLCLADHLPAGAGAATFADDFQLPCPSSTTLTSTSPPPVLPAGHHLVYFPLQAPASHLLPDGTDPAQWPGPPFMRRLWAGGALHFKPSSSSALLLNSCPAICVERLGATRVTGQPGREKVFVDVWRRYGRIPDTANSHNHNYNHTADTVEANPALEERRTLVFLRANPDSPPTQETACPPTRVVRSPYPPDDAFSLTPSPALLFNFSALSYNAHAIHLNPDHCRRVEGLRTILVHGPLLLILLLCAVRRQVATTSSSSPSSPSSTNPDATIRSIEYRNLASLYAGESLRVCIRRNPNSSANHSPTQTRWDVWIEGPDGGLAVRGVAITDSAC